MASGCIVRFLRSILTQSPSPTRLPPCLAFESGAHDCEILQKSLLTCSRTATSSFGTKLIGSNVDERVNVEVAMREMEVRWILRELVGDRQAISLTNVNAMDLNK